MRELPRLEPLDVMAGVMTGGNKRTVRDPRGAVFVPGQHRKLPARDSEGDGGVARQRRGQQRPDLQWSSHGLSSGIERVT